jgi:hypothetical protein
MQTLDFAHFQILNLSWRFFKILRSVHYYKKDQLLVNKYPGMKLLPNDLYCGIVSDK